MSKKLVIPTLETQQKYPLFYAEATKTINDIIEHISKERGIYTSNIEPDPKEHLIWLNTNFNIIYFYDEKTKKFISISGGGGDSNEILTLLNDLRDELGNVDDWVNNNQDSTIYTALNRIDTEINKINQYITDGIQTVTVENMNYLFNLELLRNVYKVVVDNGAYVENYILTIAGSNRESHLRYYTLYGNNAIYTGYVDGSTISEFTRYDIQSIKNEIGDEDMLTEQAQTIKAAIAEINLWKGNAKEDIERANSTIGTHGEELISINTLLTQLQNIIGSGNIDNINFLDAYTLTACVNQLAVSLGSPQDWVNNNQDYTSICDALTKIINTLKTIKQNYNFITEANLGTEETPVELQPNTYYSFIGIPRYIDFVQKDNSIVEEYVFKFTISPYDDITDYSISFNKMLYWSNNDEPIWEVGKTYEISVIGNTATYNKFVIPQ